MVMLPASRLRGWVSKKPGCDMHIASASQLRSPEKSQLCNVFAQPSVIPSAHLPLYSIEATASFSLPHTQASTTCLLSATSSLHPAIKMQQHQPDCSERWIQHQRRNSRTTRSWSCTLCTNGKIRTVFGSEHTLWEHAQAEHSNNFAGFGDMLDDFKKSFIEDCCKMRSAIDDSWARARNPIHNDVKAAQPEPPPANKRLLVTRNRISAGSVSLFRDSSASSPRCLKIRPVSSGHQRGSEQEMFDGRPQPLSEQLWTKDASPLSKLAVVNPMNVASIQAQKDSTPSLRSRSRKHFHSIAKASPGHVLANHNILGRNLSLPWLPARFDDYNMIMEEAQSRQLDRPSATLTMSGTIDGQSGQLRNETLACLHEIYERLILFTLDPWCSPEFRSRIQRRTHGDHGNVLNGSLKLLLHQSSPALVKFCSLVSDDQYQNLVASFNKILEILV
ncbi:hypothetical protein BKA64DRAFT_3531 [Cadophora sp. MPI-SDFR-AT-0126]|nr:hypothetical protein BKA64DRAFT_3531 [Leotiomycetes sp. MPI-SDFR-AT-0126]